MKNIKKIINARIENKIEKLYFDAFRKLLKKYKIDIYLKDSLGLFIQRKPDDNFEFIFKTGCSCDATPFMKYLDRTLTNKMVCFDVGANIGITTSWMAKKTKMVYAFEPEGSNVDRLNENLKANNIKNVIVEEKAVSDTNGHSSLNVSDDYGHHSLGVIKISNNIVSHRRVETVTLDSYCQKNNIPNIDVLKIDVEGFEYEVLKGSKNMLRNHKIKLVVFEISNVILKELKKKPAEIIDYLKSYGYIISDLEGNEIDETNEDLIKYGDYLAHLK